MGMGRTTGFSGLGLLPMRMGVQHARSAHRRLDRRDEKALRTAARQGVRISCLRRTPESQRVTPTFREQVPASAGVWLFGGQVENPVKEPYTPEFQPACLFPVGVHRRGNFHQAGAFDKWPKLAKTEAAVYIKNRQVLYILALRRVRGVCNASSEAFGNEGAYAKPSPKSVSGAEEISGNGKSL